MRLIAYIRLSKGNSKGHSLDSQHDVIGKWCRQEGHRLVAVVAEVGSARNPTNLNGRRLAVAAIKGGMADAIVVRDLDRVTRSVADGAWLLNDATDNGWRLLGVDGLDTADPEQELTRHIKIAVAQEERRKTAQRTQRALATARRNGTKMGKPRQVKPSIERRITKEAAAGSTPYRIAKALDAAGVPTPQGGRCWSPAVVRDVITRNRKAVAS